MSLEIEALKGEGPIPVDQGVYEMSATQKAELGRRIAFTDGRAFRYSLAGGTALAPGKLVMSVVNDASVVNVLVYAAVAAGGKTVILETTGAFTTGAEGFLQINDVTGEGIQYKIKKSAANATTAAYTDFTLYDPIATALDITSQATVINSLYKDLVIGNAANANVVGVPPITVTAENYFWLQTWGLCPIISEGTPAIGDCLMVGGGDCLGYGVTTATAWTSIYVGDMFEHIGVQHEYKPVYLKITP